MCTEGVESRDKRKELMSALDAYIEQRVADALQKQTITVKQEEYCCLCGKKK